MQISSSAADYIVAIYELAKASSQVRSIDIARSLGYSKPSVSRAVAALKSEGYIEVRETGEIILCAKGTAVAKSMAEKQAVLEKLLQSAGVPQNIANKGAALMKYSLSDEVFACLKKRPATASEEPREKTPAKAKIQVCENSGETEETKEKKEKKDKKGKKDKDKKKKKKK